MALVIGKQLLPSNMRFRELIGLYLSVRDFWHGAESHGDYWQQWSYWDELLGSEAFNLK